MDHQTFLQWDVLFSCTLAQENVCGSQQEDHRNEGLSDLSQSFNWKKKKKEKKRQHGSNDHSCGNKAAVKSVRVFKELFGYNRFSVVSFSVEASNLHNCESTSWKSFFFSFLELHLEGLEFLPGSIFSYPQLFFLDLCLLSARISVLMRPILKTCLQKLRDWKQKIQSHHCNPTEVSIRIMLTATIFLLKSKKLMNIYSL